MSILDQIPEDKMGHGFLGALGGFVAVGAISVITGSFIFGVGGAIALVMLGAGLKEWYDSMYPLTNHVELWDWLATVIGGGIGIIGYLTIYWMIFNL